MDDLKVDDIKVDDVKVDDLDKSLNELDMKSMKYFFPFFVTVVATLGKFTLHLLSQS